MLTQTGYKITNVNGFPCHMSDKRFMTKGEAENYLSERVASEGIDRDSFEIVTCIVYKQL